MDRPIVYTGEALRDYDIIHGWRDFAKGLARLAFDLAGTDIATPGNSALTPPTRVAGFAISATGTTLVLTISEGFIYQMALLDSSQYGSLSGSADTSEGSVSVYQQGRYAGGPITLTPPASAGQWQWNLIEAQFQSADTQRNGDPSGGVLPYYNSANPAVPLVGPGGLGTVQSTIRQGTCVLQVKLGATAGSAGAAVAPSVDAGWVPLYVVLLQNGQTGITNAQVAIAGPNMLSNGGQTPSSYGAAPFLRGAAQRGAIMFGTLHTDGAGNVAIGGDAIGVKSVTISTTQIKVKAKLPPNVAADANGNAVIALASIPTGVTAMAQATWLAVGSDENQLIINAWALSGVTAVNFATTACTIAFAVFSAL